MTGEKWDPVPEADAQEQEREWSGDESPDAPVTVPPDAPEADALEQAQEVDMDDDRERP